MALEHLSDEDLTALKQRGLIGLSDEGLQHLRLPSGYGQPSYQDPAIAENGVLPVDPLSAAVGAATGVSAHGYDLMKQVGEQQGGQLGAVASGIGAAGSELENPQTKLGQIANTAAMVPAGLGVLAKVGDAVGLDTLGQKAASLLMRLGGKPATQAGLLSKNLGAMYENFGMGRSAEEAGAGLGAATNNLDLMSLEDSLKSKLRSTQFASGATGPTVLPGDAIAKSAADYTKDLGSEIVANPQKYGSQELYNVVNSVSKVMDAPSMYPGYENLRALPAAQFKNLAALKSAALDGIVSNEQANVDAISQRLGNITEGSQQDPAKLAAMSQLESAKHIRDLHAATDDIIGQLHNQVQSGKAVNPESWQALDAVKARMEAGNSADILANVNPSSVQQQLAGAQQGLESAQALGPLRKNFAIAEQAESMNNIFPRNLNGSVSLVRSLLMGAIPGIGTLTQSPLLQKAVVGLIRSAYTSGSGADSMAVGVQSLMNLLNTKKQEEADQSPLSPIMQSPQPTQVASARG